MSDDNTRLTAQHFLSASGECGNCRELMKQRKALRGELAAIRRAAIEPYETKHSRCKLCGAVWLFTSRVARHNEGCVLADGVNGGE